MRTATPAFSLTLLLALGACAAQPDGAGGPSSSASVAGSLGPTGVRAACEGVVPDGEPVEIPIESNEDVFSTDLITGPRHCQPFVLVFTNNDPILHNVGISTEELGQGEYLLFGEKITGPETIRYEVAGIPAGEYFFVCTLHWQSMNGRLTVSAA
jgi:hypothetical protein